MYGFCCGTSLRLKKIATSSGPFAFLCDLLLIPTAAAGTLEMRLEVVKNVRTSTEGVVFFFRRSPGRSFLVACVVLLQIAHRRSRSQILEL